MDRLILIPILLAAVYFMYKYAKNALKGTGGCHGNCASCSQSLMKEIHGGKTAKGNRKREIDKVREDHIEKAKNH